MRHIQRFLTLFIPSERLPRYMVPTAFLRLEKVPALPNGKVDRRALPPITVATSESSDKMEALCKAAALALNVPHVSPDDDLNALGMDSVTYIEILMDAKFDIKKLLKAPQHRTPREILQYC